MPLAAWLLLLLSKDGENHGWALLGALHDRGIPANHSHAYRTLRELERAGELTSRWSESGGGPRRRSYRLSAAGRRALTALVAEVMVGWYREETFLRAVGRAQTNPPPDDREPAETAAHPFPPGAGAAEPAGRVEIPRYDRPPAPSRELIAAWVLLQLEGGASHGYDLRRALAERDLHPDAGTLYRLLRELDRAGWVQSRWLSPAAGPPRRLYRITASGRRNRSELTRLIADFRDSRAVFLDDWARKPGEGLP